MDWHACLAEVEPKPLEGRLLRLVESQEQVATSKLVGTLARQAILEDLLERTKPAPRPDTEGLHYLLATPFRYPPLPWGSRFGSRTEPSLFYGSLTLTTLLWETAYYRFVFWHGMATPPPRKLTTQHTLFEAAYRADPGLRLQAPPFSAYRAMLTDPADYREPQALGRAMRDKGVQAFEFISARDPAHGINVALFTPLAFAHPRPISQDAWLGEVDARSVQFRAFQGREIHDFPIERFLVEGRLPRAA